MSTRLSGHFQAALICARRLRPIPSTVSSRADSRSMMSSVCVPNFLRKRSAKTGRCRLSSRCPDNAGCRPGEVGAEHTILEA